VLSSLALVFFLLNLFGIQFPMPDVSENEQIAISVSAPEQVKVNEAFSIKGSFENKTDQQLKIMSGNSLFYYHIKDKSGKRINNILRLDVARYHTMSGSSTTKEEYLYKIKKPGVYKIVAIAEFTVLVDKLSGNNYKLVSDPVWIEVVD
jgi:hypothetical protein